MIGYAAATQDILKWTPRNCDAPGFVERFYDTRGLLGLPIRGVMTTLRTRRTYDHRIREMICETGDPDLFPELKIPRSTIRNWFRRGIPDVVTCDLLSVEKTELLAEMQELRHRTAVLGAIVGLLVAMLRVSEHRLDHERLPEGNGKRALLRAHRASE